VRREQAAGILTEYHPRHSRDQGAPNVSVQFVEIDVKTRYRGIALDKQQEPPLGSDFCLTNSQVIASVKGTQIPALVLVQPVATPMSDLGQA
jgi:hypothetical protein